MKIGYCVEGATDRAFLSGLRERWCPHADLVEGKFRGTTGESLRREIPQICRELASKSCEFLVFLTDSNVRSWRKVKGEQWQKVPVEYRDLTIIGVPETNVECWLCADANWIAQQTRRNQNQFLGHNPKGALDAALGITSFDRKEKEISLLTRNAPLKNWIEQAKSFEDFYDDVWNMAKRVQCQMRNERE